MLEVAVRPDARSETRVAGVAVSVAARRRHAALRFAGVAFEGDTALDTFEGSHADANLVRRMAEHAAGQALVTDAPLAVLELCQIHGVRPPILWDVLELAGLVAPECPTQSLDDAATFFGLAGRDLAAGPLAAAHLVLDLFTLLVCLLDAVDTPTLVHLSRLAAPLDWPLRLLFAAVERGRARSVLETGALAEATPIGAWIAQGAAGPGRRRPASEPVLDPPPLDLADVAARLAPNTALANALDAEFEPRREQVRMAQLVAETLNTGGQTLIEAGTGTGKSLAYLLPTALHALQAGRRILISTATTSLQDQLFQHDLPLVQASLAGHAQPLRATVLKGRANYLCLRRWQTLLQAPDLSAEERTLLIKTLFWLPRTRTGDRAELRLTPREEEAWQRLNAVSEHCTPSRCAYHRIGVCYLARARRAAEESHVVITNHALLLSDLVSRSRVLPDYDVLVVDEAHHLEDEATAQLGWRIGHRELIGRLERLWTPGTGATGAVPEALGLISAANGLRLPPELLPVVQAGEAAVLELYTQAREFFDGLARLLEDPELVRGGDDTALRVTGAVRAGSAWQELENVWSSAVTAWQQLERSLAEIVADLEALPGPSDAARDLGSELAAHADYWHDLVRRMQPAVHTPDPGAVHWVAGGGRQRTAWLNAAPLEVASMLRERLFGAPEASVLVSATLAIGGSFDYVKRRLGLEDARAAALGSPFDYGQAALLYVPNDLPDPTQAGYQSLLEHAILDAVTHLRGRTLVLFTSRAHLRTTYQALRAPLAAQHITLLGQGIDESSRTRLLESFRRGSRVVLFGTNAFWEGIDVVGEALSCVIVVRLPFAVPTDPVYTARAEQFEQPFMEYAVPQAVLRLKQGFGRLIRSRADRGAVVVLDRRLVTRLYGQVFLRSLPACSVKQGPVRRTGIEVAEWLNPPGPVPQTLALPGVPV